MKRTIALVTDFGHKSAYSGIMKGVIWSINPEANIADLSHGIDIGDISEAAYILMESIDYFPVGTVFVCVVDPGVGSTRRIIAIDCKGKIILVPDNGIASVLFNKICKLDTKIYSITNKEYYLAMVSNTFHGRDIFAPVAAWISSGAELKKIGEEVAPVSLVNFELPEINIRDDGSIEGQVVRIDPFGNLITNIREEYLKNINDFQSLIIVEKEIMISSVVEFYAKAKENELTVLVGSSGYLELAVKDCSAEKILLIGRGSKVILRLGINEN